MEIELNISSTLPVFSPTFINSANSRGKIFSEANSSDKFLPVKISFCILPIASLTKMLLVTLLLMSKASIIDTPALSKFANTRATFA